MNGDDRTRLDRIEEKIDKMTEAIVSLARAEEKIHSLEEKTVTTWQSIDDLHVKFDDIEDRLREAECILGEAKSTISGIVKFGWVVIGALVTGIVAAIFMLFNVPV
jgi:chromosome segregation ATPase|tara:strand:- start:385 stop:702 length:318 start_codon:yes stop_codon:yes gene_type:complete